MARRVVLAYSGGLDTSVAVRWMQEEWGVEVVALAVDVGQFPGEIVQGGHGDFEAIKRCLFALQLVAQLLKIIDLAVQRHWLGAVHRPVGERPSRGSGANRAAGRQSARPQGRAGLTNIGDYRIHRLQHAGRGRGQ